METPPDVRYVMRDGRSIAFQKWGSGTRRLVFVNRLLFIIGTAGTYSYLILRCLIHSYNRTEPTAG